MDKKLNLDIIQSFASAAVSTFEQMCSVTVTPGKPYLKKPGSSIYGVSAVIGITGEVKGVVVLTLPETVSLKTVGAFVGETYSQLDASVVDGVKELDNIIVGMAKASLDERGYQFNFSLPKVVVGHNFITEAGENINSIVIPFECPYGEFILDISIKKV